MSEAPAGSQRVLAAARMWQRLGRQFDFRPVRRVRLGGVAGRTSVGPRELWAASGTMLWATPLERSPRETIPPGRPDERRLLRPIGRRAGPRTTTIRQARAEGPVWRRSAVTAHIALDRTPCRKRGRDRSADRDREASREP